MADNPNISSARPYHGGGTPRRTSTGHNQRVMNVDNDYRRYRNNHNFQSSRSVVRTRPERPQHSNNRNTNRNRSDRPPQFRNYRERFYSDNYPERVFYPNTSNEQRTGGDANKFKLNTSNEGRNRNGDQEMGVPHNKDYYNGDVSSNEDQENRDSDLLGHLRYHHPEPNVNKEPFMQGGLPISPDNAECLGGNMRKEGSELDDPRAIRNKFPSRPTSRSASSRPASSEPPYFDNLSAVADLSLGLPDCHNMTSDNSKSTLNKLPRAIKGCSSSHASATGGLSTGRPISRQKLNGANDSEMKSDLPHTVTSGALHEEWANAPEFIPKGSKPKSYAEVVTPKSGQSEAATKKLCPYAEKSGECRVPPGCCPYLHGDVCELCGNSALHPHDADQRKQHHQQCLARHEREMEISFAVARSKEKTCGICFEVVLEKQFHERRFGILTQCNHCFCLGCIRKWRQARQFEHKVVRACPECRVTSDFVCPSVYWVETKEEKDKLIENYKNALAQKQCKYFKQGRGSCPFGNKCFYLHALPDGTKTDVGPPPRRRRNNRNRHAGDESEIGDMLQQIILWDFLDEHDHHWLYSFADDIEELAAFFSDSDESESWSDYEFLLD